MPQRICLFLVVFLLMFSGNIFGQDSLIFKKEPEFISIGKQPALFEKKFSAHGPLYAMDCTNRGNNFRLIRNLPTASCYPSNLGLICRAELKLDKITPVPFRFRLGSVDYVNWMEGKPNATKPR